MNCHSEEALDLALLAHNGHTVHQGHRIQQVTQIHKSPMGNKKGVGTKEDLSRLMGLKTFRNKKNKVNINGERS